MIGKKLYRLTKGGFELPVYVDSAHRVRTVSAGSIPFLHWPNGAWCFEANAYLLAMFLARRSVRCGGGTLLTYATQISHLIRFCWGKRLDFIDLSDTDFCRFVAGLSDADPNTAQPSRDANTVIAIGRECLNFLAYVGRCHGEGDFVGPAGRIVCEYKESRRPASHKRAWATTSRGYRSHRAFPELGEKRIRNPIPMASIDRLRSAAVASSSSAFLLKRRLVMLKLLENTGGRRSEVGLLQVGAIRRAVMTGGELEMPVLKREEGAHRSLPVALHDLLFVLEYIDVNRASLLRRLGLPDGDLGQIFIDARNGGPLDPRAISKEIHMLRRTAGIESIACAHMFRHRFITKLFVHFILEHQCHNEDEFRRALLDDTTLKRAVIEWTGHRWPESLEPYIHLAFDEITGFAETVDAVKVAMCVTSFMSHTKQFQVELARGGYTGQEVRELVDQYDAALRAFSGQLLAASHGSES